MQDSSHHQGALPAAGLDPQIVHVGRFEWERIVRRLYLGFYSGRTKDPKRWVRASTVHVVALTAVTYGDLDGTHVRPTLRRLALVCELDEKTVRLCFARLRQVNLLEQTAASRSPGRRGGAGRAAEYRLTFPGDLFERVAHLDPDEQELIVPEGVDLGPERKPRRRGSSDAASWSGSDQEAMDEPTITRLMTGGTPRRFVNDRGYPPPNRLMTGGYPTNDRGVPGTHHDQ